MNAQNLCVTRKRRLDPKENFGSFSPVVANETYVPARHDDQAGQDFEDDGSRCPHVVSDASGWIGRCQANLDRNRAVRVAATIDAAVSRTSTARDLHLLP